MKNMSMTSETNRINEKFLATHNNVVKVSDKEFKKITDNVTQKYGSALKNLAKGPGETIEF